MEEAMTIYVYHNPDFLEFYRGASEQTPDLRRLYLAAIVDTEEPEIAYRFTQHLGMEWFEHPNVTTVVHSRSTAVGDVLATEDGRLLLVASFGFKELADASLPAASSALVQTLRSLTPVEGVQGETAAELTRQVSHLYTSLLFAASVLEVLAEDVDRPDPQQVLLARFAAEQARWALAQAEGG
jgi:hypothetical protein